MNELTRPALFITAFILVAAAVSFTLLGPDGDNGDPPTNTTVTTAAATTPTTAAAQPTTSTLPAPTTTTGVVTTLPVTGPPTRSGVFVPGWDTCGQAEGVYYGQTYVGPFEAEGVLTHRINEIRCDDNVPFIYMQIPDTPNRIVAGAYDAFITEWFAEYFALCAAECILAPLAEGNGEWAPWHTDVPAEYIAAYQHVQNLAAPFGETTWAYAPAQVIGWKDYAPPDYDVLAPSVYDARGDLTALDVIGRVATMKNYFDKPTILAQTGTTRTGTDRDQWITDVYRLATRESILGVIYFDCTCPPGFAPYEYPGGLLTSTVYQNILTLTQNQ